MDHVHHHVHDMHTTPPLMTEQTTHDHSMHNNIDGTHDHSNHHHHGHDSHVHNLFFNTLWQGTVLFESFDISTKTGIFLVIVMTIIISILYEGVKFLRQYIHRDVKIAEMTIKSREHLLQTLLYLIQFLGSYLLMLVVMTYNVWLFVATLVGLGLGYFLCEWKVGSLSFGRRSNTTCPGSCHNAILNKENPARRDFREPELEPLREGMEVNPDIDMKNVRETKI